MREQTLRLNPWCAIEDCKNLATEVDHKIPLSAGGEAFDQANLQPLCKRHHSQKTARETWGRKGRGIHISNRERQNTGG